MFWKRGQTTGGPCASLHVGVLSVLRSRWSQRDRQHLESWTSFSPWQLCPLRRQVRFRVGLGTDACSSLISLTLLLRLTCCQVSALLRRSFPPPPEESNLPASANHNIIAFEAIAIASSGFKFDLVPQPPEQHTEARDLATYLPPQIGTYRGELLRLDSHADHYGDSLQPSGPRLVLSLPLL